MPLYEYSCEDCGLHFEVRQKFSDAPITSCRQCDGNVKKLISQTAFALKGGGWYQEGYGQSGCKSKQPDSSSKGDSKPVETKKACASCPNATK